MKTNEKLEQLAAALQTGINSQHGRIVKDAFFNQYGNVLFILTTSRRALQKVIFDLCISGRYMVEATSAPGQPYSRGWSATFSVR